ncbi:luc7-like protein 3 [Drosophila guanche]|uniref:luc7-like protein 3 n=1 Tax=Drosophila guanche TaxID=7266 RepID=UPI0014718AD5|nr:luc7-like protein 3 [Drosophila guanche]
MKFSCCALLLIATACLAQAAVKRSDDGNAAQLRYRLLRQPNKLEGRSLTQLLALKNGTPPCPAPTGTTVTPSTTTTTITPPDTTTTGTTTTSPISSPTSSSLSIPRSFIDDLPYGRSGSGSGSQVSNSAVLKEFEFRRQQDENKALRKQLQSMRRRNTMSRRRAQEKRRRMRRRLNQKRRSQSRRSRRNRSQASRRQRAARRRQRRNSQRRLRRNRNRRRTRRV